MADEGWTGQLKLGGAIRPCGNNYLKGSERTLFRLAGESGPSWSLRAVVLASG